MRSFIAAALLAAIAVPAFADDTTGTVLAHDRVAGLLVLKDKTVWSLELLTSAAPEIEAGDKVHIVYTTAGEDGITNIAEIKKVTE